MLAYSCKVWCVWCVWVGGVGGMCKVCVYVRMSLYAHECADVRVCGKEDEKRAGHTRSSKAIACLLQKTRLDMLCDLVGWRTAPPHARVAVLSNRIRSEGGRGSGEGYIKSPSSSPPVHKGSHLPNLLKNTTHTRTPDQTHIHVQSLRTLSPSNQHVSLVSILHVVSRTIRPHLYHRLRLLVCHKPLLTSSPSIQLLHQLLL